MSNLFNLGVDHNLTIKRQDGRRINTLQIQVILAGYQGIALYPPNYRSTPLINDEVTHNTMLLCGLYTRCVLKIDFGVNIESCLSANQDVIDINIITINVNL